MAPVLLTCTDCNFATTWRPGAPVECPLCGGRLIREFDEDGDHDERSDD